jgi:hypothetical protein
MPSTAIAGPRSAAFRDQFLDPPVDQLADPDLVLRWTRQGMAAGKLFQVASRPADHAKHLAVECDFEDSRRPGAFSEEQNLVGPGRDA